MITPRSKKEYLETIFLKYRHATRKQKTFILDEFCATLGYHRKHAIRLLRKLKRFHEPKTQKPGRTPIYAHPSLHFNANFPVDLVLQSHIVFTREGPH